jgi:hypothetical protein
MSRGVVAGAPRQSSGEPDWTRPFQLEDVDPGLSDRAAMAGAILALGAVVAVTITMQTGSALLGAAFFPIGFCVLHLMGFDLLTGVFVPTPLAWLDRRTGVTIPRIL